ncbi:aerial mycelium formation protein [Euzebya sp.]|uniref:RsiG family protein n=1 Tax=Euzebya sp. TaxID=1971409 RepID=UPI0035138EE2
MADETPHRRRIDRVTSDTYLEGLADRAVGDIRAMRDECREEEARLSYARRLLHGQLDVVKAELERRDGGGSDSLVTTLGEILADQPRGGPVRSVGDAQIFTPSGPTGRRPGDTVLDDVPLSRLPDLDDEELAAVVTRLTDEESSISSLRRTVLDHLDRLQEELVVRYRDGVASIDEVVPPGQR